MDKNKIISIKRKRTARLRKRAGGANIMIRGVGGIVGIFRQNAVEQERTVPVGYLDPGSVYAVRRGPSGEEITRLTGKELEQKGFTVKFDRMVDGALFEIYRVPGR